MRLNSITNAEIEKNVINIAEKYIAIAKEVILIRDSWITVGIIIEAAVDIRIYPADAKIREKNNSQDHPG